jgi:hypothetical protein
MLVYETVKYKVFFKLKFKLIILCQENLFGRVT